MPDGGVALRFTVVKAIGNAEMLAIVLSGLGRRGPSWEGVRPDEAGRL
jgi:hypothetical protein